MNRDPLGYYALLGIDPEASADAIKTAYRREAMRWHPDRNHTPGATARFQRLQTAFAVLGDGQKRAVYDLQGRSDTERTVAREAPPTSWDADDTVSSDIAPVACEGCGRIPALPRYVRFYAVRSFLFSTRREVIQGVCCCACADREALKASAMTWLLGWWGIPWGIPYSIHALLVNLLGGLQPAELNARVLVHQAQGLAAMGEVELARAVVEEARVWVKRAGGDRALGAELEALSARLGAGPVRRLKNPWGVWRRAVVVQLAVMVGVVWWVVA